MHIEVKRIKKSFAVLRLYYNASGSTNLNKAKKMNKRKLNTIISTKI